MANNYGLICVSAMLPRANYQVLKDMAAKRGMSLHRFVQMTLKEYSSSNADAAGIGKGHTYPANDPLASSDANGVPLTETLAIEIPMRLGQRLHAAARQMRAPSGQPATPAWLARHLVQHFCLERNDILERMAKEVDPAYVDHVPFAGRLNMRSGVTWHVVPIRTTLAGRNAVFEAAKHRKTSVAALVRKILDKTLPAWTGDTQDTLGS